MRVAWLKELRMADLPQVGGKNASLGEMIGTLSAAGIRVPGGFATSADAFREFLAAGGLAPERLPQAAKARLQLYETMHENRVRRLVAIGFPDREAEELSQLHTPNFM